MKGTVERGAVVQ